MAKKVDHEERKRIIADTAIRMFSQVGYENVSLIMIAAAAGVSRTALYRYFSDKREVMDAAIMRVINTIASDCADIVRGHDTALDRLERVCHCVADVMFANKDFLIAVFDFVIGMVRSRENMGPEIAKFTAGTRKVIRHLIERCIKNDETAVRLDVDLASDILYSEFESCAMRIVLGTERNAKNARARFSCIMKTVRRPPNH